VAAKLALLRDLFSEYDFMIQEIAYSEILKPEFVQIVDELATTDELAAHLLFTPDALVMHKRLPPEQGTLFIKIFDSTIALSRRERATYANFFPTERLLFYSQKHRTHCWASSFLKGGAAKGGPITL
jgi:hypothetical protein